MGFESYPVGLVSAMMGGREAEIKAAIHEKLNALRKLTADNLHQKPRLDQLELLITQRIEWGEETVTARRQLGLSAAEHMIAAGRGITFSDNIRHVIKEMKDEEYSLLDQRQKKEQAISTTTFLLLPLGVFLSLTMLSLGLFFLNTGAGERMQGKWLQSGWRRLLNLRRTPSLAKSWTA